MTTTSTTTAPALRDTLPVDPYRPLAEYAGFPLAYVTASGERIEGVTELGQGSAAYEGRLIVRFADGRWGAANTVDRVGAPTFAEHLDATMREQIAAAQPCDECGEIGHDAGDHDDELSPEQYELKLNLREYLDGLTGRRSR